MNLGRFPKVKLGHMNTAIEFLPRLTKELGKAEIWIKRDTAQVYPRVATKLEN